MDGQETQVGMGEEAVKTGKLAESDQRDTEASDDQSMVIDSISSSPTPSPDSSCRLRNLTMLQPDVGVVKYRGLSPRIPIHHATKKQTHVEEAPSVHRDGLTSDTESLASVSLLASYKAPCCVPSPLPADNDRPLEASSTSALSPVTDKPIHSGFPGAPRTPCPQTWAQSRRAGGPCSATATQAPAPEAWLPDSDWRRRLSYLRSVLPAWEIQSHEKKVKYMDNLQAFYYDLRAAVVTKNQCDYYQGLLNELKDVLRRLAERHTAEQNNMDTRLRSGNSDRSERRQLKVQLHLMISRHRRLPALIQFHRQLREIIAKATIKDIGVSLQSEDDYHGSLDSGAVFEDLPANLGQGRDLLTQLEEDFPLTQSSQVSTAPPITQDDIGCWVKANAVSGKGHNDPEDCKDETAKSDVAVEHTPAISSHLSSPKTTCREEQPETSGVLSTIKFPEETMSQTSDTTQPPPPYPANTAVVQNWKSQNSTGTDCTLTQGSFALFASQSSEGTTLDVLQTNSSQTQAFQASEGKPQRERGNKCSNVSTTERVMGNQGFRPLPKTRKAAAHEDTCVSVESLCESERSESLLSSGRPTSSHEVFTMARDVQHPLSVASERVDLGKRDRLVGKDLSESSELPQKHHLVNETSETENNYSATPDVIHSLSERNTSQDLLAPYCIAADCKVQNVLNENFITKRKSDETDENESKRHKLCSDAGVGNSRIGSAAELSPLSAVYAVASSLCCQESESDDSDITILKVDPSPAASSAGGDKPQNVALPPSLALTRSEYRGDDEGTSALEHNVHRASTEPVILPEKSGAALTDFTSPLPAVDVTGNTGNEKKITGESTSTITFSAIVSRQTSTHASQIIQTHQLLLKGLQAKTLPSSMTCQKATDSICRSPLSRVISVASSAASSFGAQKNYEPNAIAVPAITRTGEHMLSLPPNPTTVSAPPRPVVIETVSGMQMWPCSSQPALRSSTTLSQPCTTLTQSVPPHPTPLPSSGPVATSARLLQSASLSLLPSLPSSQTQRPLQRQPLTEKNLSMSTLTPPLPPCPPSSPSPPSPTSSKDSSGLFPVSSSKVLKSYCQKRKLEESTPTSQQSVGVTGASTSLQPTHGASVAQETAGKMLGSRKGLLSLKTLIHHGLLSPGRDVLWLELQGVVHRAKVLPSGAVQGEDGRTHTTPRVWLASLLGALGLPGKNTAVSHRVFVGGKSLVSLSRECHQLMTPYVQANQAKPLVKDTVISTEIEENVSENSTQKNTGTPPAVATAAVSEPYLSQLTEARADVAAEASAARVGTGRGDRGRVGCLPVLNRVRLVHDSELLAIPWVPAPAPFRVGYLFHLDAIDSW